MQMPQGDGHLFLSATMLSPALGTLNQSWKSCLLWRHSASVSWCHWWPSSFLQTLVGALHSSPTSSSFSVSFWLVVICWPALECIWLSTVLTQQKILPPSEFLAGLFLLQLQLCPLLERFHFCLFQNHTRWPSSRTVLTFWKTLCILLSPAGPALRPAPSRVFRLGLWWQYDLILPRGCCVSQGFVDSLLENHWHVGQAIKSAVKSVMPGGFSAHYGYHAMPCSLLVKVYLAKCVLQIYKGYLQFFVFVSRYFNGHLVQQFAQVGHLWRLFYDLFI